MQKQKKSASTLPKELTTITPLSKMLALLLFIALPIIAFLFGMYYQSSIMSLQQAGYVQAIGM